MEWLVVFSSVYGSLVNMPCSKKLRLQVTSDGMEMTTYLLKRSFMTLEESSTFLPMLKFALGKYMSQFTCYCLNQTSLSLLFIPFTFNCSPNLNRYDEEKVERFLELMLFILLFHMHQYWLKFLNVGV